MDTSDIIPAAAAEFLTGRRRKKNLIPPEKQTGKNIKIRYDDCAGLVYINLHDPVPGHTHISSFFFSHLLGGSLNSIHLVSEE